MKKLIWSLILCMFIGSGMIVSSFAQQSSVPLTNTDKFDTPSEKKIKPKHPHKKLHRVKRKHKNHKRHTKAKKNKVESSAAEDVQAGATPEKD